MNKILKLISKAAVLVLLLSLTGCYYNDILEIEEIEVPVPAEISFANDIQPLFTASCIQCHPAFSAPDLTVGNSYAAITNGTYIVPNDVAGSLLYQRMIGNGAVMPQAGPLETAKLNLVKAWIEKGALNN